MNLPLDGERLNAVVEYVRTVKTMAGEAAVGVAVPCEVALGADGGRVLEALLNVCDFCALDIFSLSVGDVTDKAEEIRNEMLEDAKQLIAPYDYYLKQYDMRLLMKPQQTAMYEVLYDLGIIDYQIIE